jgi:hypothetical protein
VISPTSQSRIRKFSLSGTNGNADPSIASVMVGLSRSRERPGRQHPQGRGSASILASSSLTPRDAEVRDDRLATLQEDVLGLDIAVHDAVVLRVREGGGHVAGDLKRVLNRELPLSNEALARGSEGGGGGCDPTLQKWLQGTDSGGGGEEDDSGGGGVGRARRTRLRRAAK